MKNLNLEGPMALRVEIKTDPIGPSQIVKELYSCVDMDCLTTIHRAEQVDYLTAIQGAE